MPQKQVLILVLSALRPPWGAMLDKAMQTWDSIEQPNTQTVFYVGMRAPPTHPKLFCSSRYDEGLGTIGKRTIEAFQHSLSIPGWTHLARPHSSCYVHKRRLVEYINTLPETNVMYGLPVVTSSEETWLFGGGHFMYSRDVIVQLVKRQDLWDHSMMEDAAVSKLARTLGIPFGNIKTCSINPQPDGQWLFISHHSEHPSCRFTDFSELDKTDHCLFRVKHPVNRAIDLQLMDLLFKHLS